MTMTEQELNDWGLEQAETIIKCTVTEEQKNALSNSGFPLRFFIDYLLKEGKITQRQIDDYNERVLYK